VLYWSELFWPYVGGAEIFAKKMLPALRERGHEVIVVTSHDHLDLPDRSLLGDIPIYRFPLRPALASGNAEKLPENLRRVKQLKRDFAPDLVHLSGVGPTAFFHLLSEASHPAPLLVSMRTEVLASQKRDRGSLLGQSLRRADWVTAVSSAALQQTRHLVPEIVSRSSVVYNFVDVPVQVPIPISLEQPRILCLGRLITAKGFDLAMKAFASVRAEHPGAQLVVAGDGPEKRNLHRLAHHLGVEQSVQFVGFVRPTDVPDLLNSATIVMLPSRREGLPMVAIEAAMMARPIVAARTGGLPEIIIDGQTGLLVERENAQALGEALGFLLRRTDQATELGRNARTRAQAMFGRERCLDEYEGLYRQLTENRVKAFPYDRNLL
jgi:glycogen(starch) synthase